MRAQLTPHPDWPCPAVDDLEVEVSRPARDTVLLRYALAGRSAQLRLPPPRPPERTDGLWQTTCFEAFLRPASGLGYFEFNFAPSDEWAAYAFSGYREGMQPLAPLPPPRIVTRAGADRLVVEVGLSLPALSDGAWRLGLSAVVEGQDGTKSYWAVTHPPGKADFHHPDCFALDLPEALRP